LTNRINARILKHKSKSGYLIPVNRPELEVLDKRASGRGVSYLIIEDGVEGKICQKKSYRSDLDRFDKLYESMKDQIKEFKENEKMNENELAHIDSERESQECVNPNGDTHFDFSMTEEDEEDYLPNKIKF